MFRDTKNITKIYSHFFSEGVFVVEKNTHLPQNPDVPSVRNLEVIKTMQSLVSKNFAKEEFNWQTYYFFLTAEGIAYLRAYLNLPETVVPATVAKATLPTSGGRGPQRDRDDAMGGGSSGRRTGAAPHSGKSTGHHEFKPRFVGQ